MSKGVPESPEITPKKYFVALLDVLGFEGILDRLGLRALQAKYESLVSYVKRQEGGLDLVPVGGHVAIGWLVLGNAYFSDSVLFWTEFNPLGLSSFTLLVADALCYGLELALPLRGAIAVGEAVLEADRRIFLGKPLVEVARAERLQQWIGACFGPSFNPPGYSGGFHLPIVLPYKSQYKDITSPLATGMVVDWPRRWRETRKSDPRSVLEALDKDPNFSTYYSRSMAFADFSELNHDWFTRLPHLDYG